jgi:hypothetical protein
MRARTLALAGLALVLTTGAASGTGTEPMHAGHDHGGGAEAEPAEPAEPAADRDGEQIDEGNLFPGRDGSSGVFGYVKVVRFDGGTEGTLHAGGLEPGGRYVAHLHNGTCFDHGPHYQHEKDGPAGPPNELWFSGDPEDPEAGMRADDRGVVDGSGLVEWKARREARSVMIHGKEGHMVACADLS